MRRCSGEAGLTLVEISVVIAVIGILAALAMPSVINTMPKVRLNNNAMTLSSEVSLARVRAIAKSTRFRIVFHPAAETYDLQRESGGAWVAMATNKVSGSDLVGTANLLQADTLIADWNGSVNVAFGNRGLITLQTPDGAYRKRIAVESTGRVVVERSFDAGATWQGD